jgi:hypothetical protein
MMGVIAVGAVALFGVMSLDDPQTGLVGLVVVTVVMLGTIVAMGISAKRRGAALAAEMVTPACTCSTPHSSTVLLVSTKKGSWTFRCFIMVFG